MNNKKYSVILFDWDGCLSDTLGLVLQSYKEVFLEYSLTPSTKEITSKVFGDWNGPTNLGIENIEEFNQKLKAKLENSYADAPLHKNVKKVLSSLQEKEYTIGLVTTSKEDMVLPALEKHSLQVFFQSIVTADSVEKHKPDPEPIFKSLEQLGLTKEVLKETIMIGDSKSDLGAANNAGTDSVLFFPDKHSAFYNKQTLIEEYRPSYVIEKHQEMLFILGIKE